MPFFFTKDSMFYLFLFLLAVAIALLQLGALSVWFTVLSTALIAMTVVAIAVAIFALWKRYRYEATRFITHRKP
jgi:membrane protein YdbS with pleckstrin-like domain